jgi:crotonobetainyl-CoA:carnitine CoA-transferase CaiB-like acyl-CoA transferase
MSGLMDLTGPPDGLPTSWHGDVDHLTGIYAAYGTLAALEQRGGPPRPGGGHCAGAQRISVLLTSIPGSC